MLAVEEMDEIGVCTYLSYFFSLVSFPYGFCTSECFCWTNRRRIVDCNARRYTQCKLWEGGPLDAADGITESGFSVFQKGPVRRNKVENVTPLLPTNPRCLSPLLLPQRESMSFGYIAA